MEAFRRPLGGLLEPLGGLWDTSRSPLGRSRSFLGRSWSLLGHSWQPWSAHESSGQGNIRALGSLQTSKWPPKGLPRVPQMLLRGLTKDSRSTEISVQSAAYIEPFAAHIFAVANSILWQLFQTASSARTLLKPLFFQCFFMVFTMCTQRTQVETHTEFEH